MYDCELCETKHSEFLTSCGECQERSDIEFEGSDIEFEGWSLMKLATASKILCIHEDDIANDDPELVNHNIFVNLLILRFFAAHLMETK